MLPNIFLLIYDQRSKAFPFDFLADVSLVCSGGGMKQHVLLATQQLLNLGVSGAPLLFGGTKQEFMFRFPDSGEDSCMDKEEGSALPSC